MSSARSFLAQALQSMPMTETERVSFSVGQVQALRTMVCALMAAQPDLSAVMERFDAMAEIATIGNLNGTTSEAVCDGFDETAGKLRQFASLFRDRDHEA